MKTYTLMVVGGSLFITALAAVPALAETKSKSGSNSGTMNMSGSASMGGFVNNAGGTKPKAKSFTNNGTLNINGSATKAKTTATGPQRKQGGENPGVSLPDPTR